MAPNTILNNLAVSTIAYDGLPFEQAFDSIANLGVCKVEIALIDGTSSGFSEESFARQNAEEYRRVVQQHNLECVSLACHTNFERPDADDLLLRRLEFAYSIGASKIVTYTTGKNHFAAFMTKVDRALELANRHGIKILVENPSDGRDHIIGGAQDIPAFLQAVDERIFGCNYDAGNFVTHCPEEDVLVDAIAAIPMCSNMHIKDIQIVNGNIYFCPIGQGICQYEQVFQNILSARPELPFALEIPMRVFKDSQGNAHFKEEVPALAKVEKTLNTSIAFIRELEQKFA